MIYTSYQYVIYHSREWDSLVETGWVTMTVDESGFAQMIKQTRS